MKKSFIILFSFIFLFVGIIGNTFSQTATYTVTKNTDPDPKGYNYIDSLCAHEMIGTLQWAERKSMDDGIPSTIVFAIPGTGIHIIHLVYEPPAIINGDLTIDGTTQPDYQGEPLIIIDGQNKVERGLYFHDYSNYIVKGLGIQNCNRRGILFEYATNILAEYNVINRINNNETYTGTAIRIVGNPKIGHTNAIIRYNYFGTDASLNATLGCDDGGILIGPYANNNLIFGNTIAYNHQTGIYINSAIQNKISQNLIFGQDTAIVLSNGGNNNKMAPDSLLYNDSTQILSGIAEPYDTIEVFGSTGPENANEYLATAIADSYGQWQVPVNSYWDYYVVTANYLNTSSLSLPLLNPERSLSIYACQLNSLPVFVSGINAGDTLNINITLPNEIVAINQAEIDGNATISSIDTTSIHNPQYEIIVGDSTSNFTLNYFVYAGCEAFTQNLQNFQDTIEINDNGTAQIITHEYDLNTPWLVLDTLTCQNIQHQTYIGTVFTRTFTYKNTSASAQPFTGDFLFTDSLISISDTSRFKFLSIQLQGTGTLIDSATTDTSATIRLHIDDLANTDILTLKETVQLRGCDTVKTYFRGQYGCTNNSLCVDAVEPIINTATIDYPPVLEYKMITTGYQSCFSDTLERTMMIINHGSYADSVYIGIKNGSNYLRNITDHPINYFKVSKDSTGIIPVQTVPAPPFNGCNSAIKTLEGLNTEDTLYFTYDEIIHCIDPSDYDNYFNYTSHMHYEGFPYVKLYYPCANIWKEFPVGDYYYHNSWEHDFQLNQVFNNLNGVLPDQNTEWYSVNSSILKLGTMSQIDDYIFEMDSSQLVIELDLEPGLGLVDTNLFLSSVYNTDTIYLYPESITSSVGQLDSAAGNIITAYFNFPDTMHNPGYYGHGFIDKPTAAFHNFFDNFKVNFNLFADCDYAGPTANITEKVLFNANKNCSNDCLIPLASVSDDIYILCPGCILPGWNLSSFTITRSNLGFADNDNNNYPDTIPYEQTIADTNLANIHSAMINDTLEFDITGNTTDGGNIIDSLGNQHFIGFNNIGFDYKYGQMQFLSPLFDKLRYMGATGTISDSTGIYSFNLPSSTGKLYSTGFTINLDIDTLQHYGTLPATFNRFWSGNSILLKPIFIVDSNLIDTSAANPYLSTQGIDAKMNMSGVSYPQGIEILNDAVTFVQLYPDSFIAMSGNQRDSFNYRCTGWNGRFSAVGVDYNYLYNGPMLINHNNYFTNLHSCNSVLHYYFYTEVGHQVYGGYADQYGEQLPWNSFSYELRNLWMLDSLTICFPPDYYLDSVGFETTQLTSSGGLTHYTCTPWSNSPGSWHIYNISDTTATDTSVTIYPSRNFEQITASVGCNGPSSYGLTAWDETKRYRIFFIIKSNSCGLPPYQDTLNHPVISYWSNFPTTETGDTTITQNLLRKFTKPDASLATNVILPVIQDLQNSNLLINLQVAVYSPPGWDFGNWETSIKHMIADNTFIIIRSPTGTFTVDSIINTQTNQHVPIVNSILNDSVYGLGSIGFLHGNPNLKIYGSYNCENIVNKDSIQIFSGWNCDGYPNDLNSVCYLDSQWVSFIVNKPGLQSTLTISDSISICDTIHCFLLLNATDIGRVDNIQVTMPLSINNGYSYLPGSAHVEFEGNDTLLEPAYYTDSLVWNVDTLGYMIDFSSPSHNLAYLYFDLFPDCEAGNHDIVMNVSGTNYCGNIIPLSSINATAPVIIGYPQLDSLNIAVSAGNLVNCNQAAPVTVTVTNMGNAPTGSFDTVSVQLTPNGIYAGGYTLADSVGQMLYFSLPANILPDSSFTFVFTMIDDTTHSCSDTLTITACTHPVSQYACDTNLCYYTNASAQTCDTAIIRVEKPQLSFTDLSPISFCDSVNWQVAVSMNNTSNLTSYDDTISFYCYSGGSLSCLLGQTGIDSIAGNTTYTDTVNLVNTCTTCDSIVAVIGSGCMCSQDTSDILVTPPFTYTPTAHFIISDSCLVIQNAIHFIADSIPVTNYYWEFSDGTTSTDMNPVHVFENYGYYCVKLTVNNACGSDTFHLPKPIYVNLTSCACDEANGGWYDYDYRDGHTIQSYTNETWSVSGTTNRIFVEGDIIIEPHAQLIIDDSVTVEFAPNGRIIVQAGGKLTIGSNVTLTSIHFAPWTSLKNAPFCAGNMWQGIEVWGNKDNPHVESEQGIVEILNQENVTIDNAHIAILSGARNMKHICDNTEPIFDSDKGAGLVHINSETRFTDDGIGIKLLSREPLYNIGGYWSGNVIQSCNFSTTNFLLRDTEYLSTHPYAYPNAQNPWAGNANTRQRTDVGIWMNNIKGLDINNCNFNNMQICIHAFDAKFNVYGTTNKSNFYNARFGIKISNTISTIDNRHEITQCRFNNIPGGNPGFGIEPAAIDIKGGKYDYIHDNEFGYGPTFQTMNYRAIKMFNASAFNIVNNEFTKFTYGIKVINSGKGGGFVGAEYNPVNPWAGNSFSDCQKHIVTQENNLFLKLKCNMCYNHDSTLYTVNFENTGVLGNQGSYPPPPPMPINYRRRYGAGNEFAPNGLPDGKLIQSSSIYNLYDYFHHNAPFEAIPYPTVNVNPHDIQLAKINNQTSCPDVIQSISPALPLSLNTPVFTRLDSLNDEIQLLLNQYISIEANLDHGKTYELLSDIYGHIPTGTLKNKLIANSPLSDTVLIALITEYPLSHGNFKNVMELNLPVSKTTEIYFNERLENIPTGIANQLYALQGNNPQATTLTALQRAIDFWTVERQLYMNKLISVLTDTLNNRREDAITLLENEGSVWSEQTLIATYIADSNFTLASSKLSSLPVYDQETADWAELMQLLINLYQSGKTLYNLDSAEIDFIRQLAYQCPGGLGTANAQSILELLFGEYVPECPDSMQGKSLQLNPIKKISKPKEQGAWLGDNYPDPYNKQTTIPYIIPEGTEAYIIINDINGREISRHKIVSEQKALKFEAGNLKSGQYMYSLMLDGEILETKKMTIGK